jgi:Fe-S-cluster containining protein
VCDAHACSECCYEIEMPLTEDDVARLERAGKRRADFSFVDDDGTLLLVNVQDGERRHCTFLVGGRCSVYADRPAGCRLYPFVLGPDAKRVVRDLDCPWRREFANDPAAGRRLQVVYGAIVAEAARRRTAADALRKR